MFDTTSFICVLLIKTDTGYKEDYFFINGTFNFALERADYRLASLPKGSSYTLYQFKYSS